MKVLLFIAGIVFTAYAGSFQICVEDNVDYWGADIREFRAKSFSDCAKACAQEQVCRAITYHKGGRRCWLKHTPFGEARYKQRGATQLKSANLNCNKYSTLPAWPQDFRWSNAGTPRGYTCVKIWESRGPPTWNDNYMCWRNDRADPGLRWSMAGPIPGQRCTQIIEGAEPAKYTWKDNYLCVQHNSPYHFAWAYSNGLRDQHKRHGKVCIQWYEPADPYTWKDNWLCGNRVASRSAGTLPSWPQDFRWSSAGVPRGYNCDRIWELAANPRYTWKDNFMCWRNNKADPGIRFNMNGKVSNSKCVQILEPAEPANQTWRDNFLCIPPNSPYHFSWAFSNGQRNHLQRGGNACIRWLETADPHTWADNYLCNKRTTNPDPRRHSSNQGGRQFMLRAAHAQYVRYRGLAVRFRKVYVARTARYNAAVRSVNKYANLRNSMNARANAEARAVNAFARSHRAMVAKINATRRNCAKSVNNMARIANSYAKKMRNHHALYVRYRNQVAGYTRQYNNARRVMVIRNNQRNSAYKSYKNLVNRQNAAAKKYNRLRG